MHYRLIDEQTLVGDHTEAFHIHVVREINDAAGLATGARIGIDFDPKYQRLTLHRLDLVRGGRRISKLHKAYPLLRRETQLERQIYDGRQTLSIVLDDVRVGDEIDYAFSIDGSNPVFGGRFVSNVWMISDLGPEALHQIRILAPRSRDIRVGFGSDQFEVKTRDLELLKETIVRRENIPQRHMEVGGTLGDLFRNVVQFSEFSDWSDVARWGRPLFPGGAADEPLLAQRVAAIRAAAPDAESRLLAALEFVQKEIRYFGTEFGPNSHRPAAAEKVLEQRFGDCKDKTALLIALLSRLEIRAAPVLISIGMRGETVDRLPSPLDFDHVIAKVDLGATTYWLDPTRSYQTGPLAVRQVVGYGRGLVLSPDTDGLTELPSAHDVKQVWIVDTLRLGRIADDPTLESKTALHGDAAENFRAALATQGRDALAQQVSAAYARAYTGAELVGPVRFESSDEDNGVLITQIYRLRDYWRFVEERMLVGNLVPYALLDAMNVPNSESRQMSLGLTTAGIVRQDIVFEVGEDAFANSPPKRLDGGDSHFTVSQSVEARVRRLEFGAELHVIADRVAPSEWKAFYAKIDEIRRRLNILVSVPAFQPAQAGTLFSGLNALSAHPPQIRSGTSIGGLEYEKRLLVLSADISGGRLPPRIEAQARSARGMLYQIAGHPESARKEYDRALELAPDSADLLSSAAANALQMQEVSRAIELASKALKSAPESGEALRTRAIARYLSGDTGGAQADLASAVKNPQLVRDGYALVWLGLIRRQASPAASNVLKDFSTASMPAEWPRPLIDFVSGQIGADALVAAARKTKNFVESLCGAYFVLGEEYAARGQQDEARRNWQLAIDQNVAGFVENSAARYRLHLAPPL